MPMPPRCCGDGECAAAEGRPGQPGPAGARDGRLRRQDPAVDSGAAAEQRALVDLDRAAVRGAGTRPA